MCVSVVVFSFSHSDLFNPDKHILLLKNFVTKIILHVGSRENDIL